MEIAVKFIKFDTGGENAKDGRRRYPAVFEKDEKYGEVISRETISVASRLVLIVGPHDCGKSRYLKKFYEFGNDIYRSQMKKGTGKTREEFTPSPPIFLKATDSLTDWAAQIEVWYDENFDGGKFSKLRTSAKFDMMTVYLEDTRALLLIDDIDKLSEKRVQIVKQLIESSYRCVATCCDENRIHPSLRGSVMGKCDHVVRLDSKVSYDVTSFIVWILTIIVGFSISSTFGALLLIGGAGKLGHGLGATRNK